MKKIWTLAVVAALGISTIGCGETATTPAKTDVKPLPAGDAKPEGSEMKEEPKADEPKKEEPKAEEPKKEEPKAEEPKADAPK